MKIMELGEIKQFPIFEMTCQNTKQWRGKLCVIYIHPHYGIYHQQQSIQGKTSPLHLQYPNMSSSHLNSIPKECQILGVCRAQEVVSVL